MLTGKAETLDVATLRMRQATIVAGIWLTYALSVLGFIYVGLTWSRPDRPALLAVWIIAVVGAGLVSVAPRERIVHTRLREPFFLTWSLLDVLLIATGTALDGGTGSPMTVLFFLPGIFAAMSYPIASVLTVGLSSLIGYATVAVVFGGEPMAVTIAFAAALASAACVSTWQANNHKRQHSALREASRTDPLTGCLNRRGFEERADAEIAAMRRSVRQGAVIVLDLDHFKSVNDKRGHAAGDELLCWVVATLMQAVRPSDAVGRLGGDEFAVLLPDIGPAAAHATMLRIRSALLDRAPCAAGLAIYPEDGTDLDTLTREADMRLYAAREGRDPAAPAAATNESPTTGDLGRELAMADAERMQAALIEEIDAAVMVTDPEGTILSWNRGAESLYGWSREDALGRKVRELIVPPEQHARRPLVERLRRDSRWDGEMVLLRSDGSRFTAYVRSRLILDSEGQAAAIVGVSVDISSSVDPQGELAQSREYAHAVAESMGEGLVTIDEEGRATYVNPAAEAMLGWSREELLGQSVHELIHARRADGSLLAAEDCPILRSFQERAAVTVEDDSFMTRSGLELPVSYSANPFQTRNGERGCVVIFRDNTEGRRREQERRRDSEALAWLQRVEEALAEDRLVLYAQPIVELGSGRAVQHELLLRMRERDGTIVPPGAFLAIAERHALIGEIDWWVIRRAFQIAAMGSPVELNLSARSVGDADVLQYVERCIEEYAPPPRSVVFELTETAILEDESAARRFAERVRTLGCEVALDDFGTGYGGFTYLKQLPVDYLKIDIEFVRDLATSQASRHVVQAVVALARDFDLRTVAEGVEDEATLKLLIELGVDLAQGYHIARPEGFSVRPGDHAGNGRHNGRALRRRSAGPMRAGAGSVQ